MSERLVLLPTSMAARGDQRRAAALARTFLAQSARKTFISARNVFIRGATPLYFFVMPETVLLTAPSRGPIGTKSIQPARTREPV